jgi:hypothetical protein
LEAVTDAKVGDGAGAGHLGGLHHPARPPIAEASGHDKAVGVIEERGTARRLERLGFDPLDVDFQTVRKTAVIQGLVEAFVRTS